MLPFPSDYYTVPDPSMPSGRRVDFPVSAMPRNSSGTPIDPAPYARNDGFSPGSTILVHVPGIDLSRSNIPGNGFVGESIAPNAGVVLLDATTGRRLAYWGELDARDSDPATQLLMIHPAWNLPEGHRILVGLRGLQTAAGVPLMAQAAFASILSGSRPQGVTSQLAVHIGKVTDQLEASGVNRSSLYLAWDFTVDSEQNLTGWALHMRDVSLGMLGSGGVPHFKVAQVTDYTTAENPYLSREVSGTFGVPSFLNEPGGPPGSVLEFGTDGLPAHTPGQNVTAEFACNIPRSDDSNPRLGRSSPRPGRPVLYGIGLFGLATNTSGENVWPTADASDSVMCSTNWLGLSGNDVAYDAQFLLDLSKFPSVADRLLQSLIDALYLGRLMASPAGFDSNNAFRVVTPSGHSASFIDTSRALTYYGNSEGSLAGGALTAISTEFRRSVLGVPSMDYALLLDRSIDFDPFFSIFNTAYPGAAQQQVILDVLQMLWDRGETDGYAEQMTSHPLPGTPEHQVLLQMTFGDQQVSNYSTEIEARTIGAHVHEPALRPGREPGDPFYGLRAITTNPFEGPAALYVWDPGVPAPPPGDIPPTLGPDPHDTVPRTVPAAQRQLDHFQVSGQVLDVCGSAPCVAPTPPPTG